VFSLLNLIRSKYENPVLCTGASHILSYHYKHRLAALEGKVPHSDLICTAQHLRTMISATRNILRYHPFFL
jgi:hypothetical protein